MVALTRHHAPAVALLVLGATLTLLAGFQVADAVVVTHHHAVERVDETTVDGEDVQHYANLSGRARWAFDTAVAAPDSERIVRSVTRRPDPAYAGDATAETYVRYRGEYYRQVSWSPRSGSCWPRSSGCVSQPGPGSC